MRNSAKPGGRDGRGASCTSTRPSSRRTESMSPQYNQEFMSAETGLLFRARTPAHLLKTLWRGRRTSNAPLDQSGVWRYLEMIPFLGNYDWPVVVPNHADKIRSRRCWQG